MHLTPSDPDIATLYRKIKQARLDLQPNFQRGEVWGKGKKQRLIDSILRGWHIPPIHVIQIPNSDKQEVLDGQQRLAAIRDFMQNEFPINGEQAPLESTIQSLDGFFWNDLTQELQSRIEDFTVRLLTISDYQPGEPGELFYRLNQPTNLTSAEQRNAYFGEARQQVKELAEYMLELGFTSELIGFSNSRMAYDDVLAKFLLTLEMGTLTVKHTANSVTARYRESTGFDNILVTNVALCLNAMRDCIRMRNDKTKLNKATIFTWLIFIYGIHKKTGSFDLAIEYFDFFESLREQADGFSFVDTGLSGVASTQTFQTIQIYQDRASSRVADVSSVILRDIILWGIFSIKNKNFANKDAKLAAISKTFYYLMSGAAKGAPEDQLSKLIATLEWGVSL